MIIFIIINHVYAHCSFSACLWCRCRMAGLELDVASDERMQFQYESRPVWPNQPTPCPVEACGMRPFNSFKLFIAHWKDRHEPEKLTIMCSCGRKFSIRKHLKCHLKTETHHVEIPPKNLRNPNFIDPGDHLAFQYGTKEDRENMKVFQRQAAAEKRKRDVENCKEIQNLLVPQSSQIVCRDECIKERGGQLVKDTNLWDSPRRRKRI